jgi:catechol 2,3-dioxygenase-like lactoylglutathione lyase family enzyme
MEPRLSFVTLGVRDLDRAVHFYSRVLGLRRLNDDQQVAFFELGRTWLALFPRHLLAADAGVPDDGRGFPGFALAHNVRTPEEVDALLDHVAAAGAKVVKPAGQADWGGRTGYFADPDGFLWEVAWNPHFPHT